MLRAGQRKGGDRVDTVTCPGLSASSDHHLGRNQSKRHFPPSDSGRHAPPPTQAASPPFALSGKSLAWAGVEGGLGRLWMGTMRPWPARVLGPSLPCPALRPELAATVPGWSTRFPPSRFPARPGPRKAHRSSLEVRRRWGHEDRAVSPHGQSTHVSEGGVRGRLFPGLVPAAAWDARDADPGDTGHQPGELQETGRVRRAHPFTRHWTRISRASTTCRSLRPGKRRCPCPKQATAG